MPLAMPAVDDRTFASLMTDAKARIPRLARGWTDHNAHDPGITLLELLAWLTETDLFRAGRVPDATRRTFLRWFGLEQRDAAVARTILAFSAQQTTPVVTISADTAVTNASRSVVFTTTTAVRVQPVRLGAVLTSEAPGLVDRFAVHERREPFAAFGARAVESNAIYLGFDRPLSGEFQFYVWTGAPDHDELTRGRLEAEDVNWRRHYGVQTVWEAFTTEGWKPVTTLVDDTRAFTLSGLVRLSIDVPHARGGADVTHWFVRCRIVRGHFDCTPSLVAVLPNAVEALNQSKPFTRQVGTSDGRAGQALRVGDGPLVDMGARVVVRWVNGVTGEIDEHEWPVVRTWDRVGPDERAVLLDATTGEIRFGNGRVGRVPRAGATITVTTRRGSGPAGNVDVHELARFASGEGDASVSIAQPFAARGGRLAESLAELQGRLLDRLARPTRAVSADDIKQLALGTPGVPVGRVRVLPEHDPNLPGLPAAGCVTVVVIPGCDGPRPEPTGAMLEAVRCYLSPRRPIATELHVVGPIYTVIAVHARLHVAPGSDSVAIGDLATARVNAFFHPLSGGPDGHGWTAGRAVYRAEILALLQDTPGVLWVEELSLVSGEGASSRTFCGNVVVCPTSLIAVAAHTIRVVEAARNR